jgi:hypothetical protein
VIPLRAIANAAIQPVNPDIDAAYRASTGATLNAAGKPTPTYALAVTVRAQVQAAKGSDLEHVANLNMEKVYRNVRVFGNAQGVVRPDAKGGDLFNFPQVPGGTIQTWLVVAVLETWPEWCSVIVCLQTD